MKHLHGSSFITEPGLTIPEVEKTSHERLSFDFDSEDNPTNAVEEATAFAKHVDDEHGASALVSETGFKGTHVVASSKPVDWETYQLVWKCLYNDMPSETRKLADVNMPQWNRVVRVFKRLRCGF